MRDPRTPALRRGATLLIGAALLVACGDPTSVTPGSSGTGSGGDDESGSTSDAPSDVPSGCGNGLVEAGEECDLGFANAIDGACTPACTLPFCGDGLLAPDETCDEGEANGGSTCTAACTIPTRLRWSTTIAGPAHGYDLTSALTAMTGGAVVVVRQMWTEQGEPEVVVERYEADGSRTWSRALPGPQIYSGLSPSLVTAADDGVLLGLFVGDPGEIVADRVELLALDAAGDLRWDHTIRTSAQGTPLTARVTRAGDEIVFAAMMEVGTDQYEALITRLDDDGTILRERFIEPAVRRAVGLPDGGFVAHAEGKLWRFDADDVEQWSTPLQGTAEVSLALDGEGRPVVARRDLSGARTLQLFSAEGQLQWEAPLRLNPHGVTASPDGSLVVAGTVDAPATELASNVDLGVEVFDGDGQPRWMEAVAGPDGGEDRGRAVAATDDGAIWLGGSVSVRFEHEDAWIGRFEEALR
ncbi:hypothetical protein [Paraliomyxa miuraensis]|uniref:hypothetical protein n=1 Tax=Paraliomyxa miuraensis TaxID=376150 RepID=UPI00224DD882|nr:hypothetical protein [Paraliomyxa miuraensis]MCX4242089.1 hypothetical protein [Paraliomyxa miuraensis]